MIKWISSTAMKALIEYSWPGNIRELQNLIERAVIRSADEHLEVSMQDLERPKTHMKNMKGMKPSCSS